MYIILYCYVGERSLFRVVGRVCDKNRIDRRILDKITTTRKGSNRLKNENLALGVQLRLSNFCTEIQLVFFVADRFTRIFSHLPRYLNAESNSKKLTIPIYRLSSNTNNKIKFRALQLIVKLFYIIIYRIYTL